MIGGLIGSLMQMGGAYGALRLKRFKAKLLMSLLSLAIFSVFGVLALVFLCVIVFIALTENYGPMTAAVTLFGVACLLCLLTVIVHMLASRGKRDLPNNDLISGLKSQLPSTLALGMALGRQTKNFSRSVLRPKNVALGILLASVTAIVSHPTSTYRLIRHLLHKDVQKVERQPLWRRFIK